MWRCRTRASETSETPTTGGGQSLDDDGTHDDDDGILDDDGACNEDDTKYFRRIHVICTNNGILYVNFLVSRNLVFN